MKRILLITFLAVTQHINAANCLRSIYQKASKAADHPAAPGVTGFFSGYTLGKCLPCEQVCTLSIGTGAGALSAHAAKKCAPVRCLPCLEQTKNCLGACTAGLILSQLPTQGVMMEPNSTAEAVHHQHCIKYAAGAGLLALVVYKKTKNR